MTVLALLAVAVGGAVGAPARYVVDTVVGQRVRSELPWGTYVINVMGSFLLGVVVGLADHHHVSSTVVDLVGTGFCGSFTTFSTFIFETVSLGEGRRVNGAALNVVGSVVTGFAVAALGIALGAL